MKRVLCIGFALTLASAATLGQESGAPQARGLIDSYCAGCHNSRTRAGGVAFDTLPLDAIHEHADVWEASVHKLRSRLMPPPESHSVYAKR